MISWYLLCHISSISNFVIKFLNTSHCDAATESLWNFLKFVWKRHTNIYNRIANMECLFAQLYMNNNWPSRTSSSNILRLQLFLAIWIHFFRYSKCQGFCHVINGHPESSWISRKDRMFPLSCPRLPIILILLIQDTRL